MEVFVDGKALVLDDYRRLEVFGGGAAARTAGKGHLEEVEAFCDAILAGGEWPIPLWQQVQATEIAFDVESRLPGV